jgi:Hemerythrin HHE cation binding domain
MSQPSALEFGPQQAGFEPPDLTGWLGGHDIMRTQFALPARASGEVGEHDARRVAALEDHLGFMIRRLDWHHHHEDEQIWPQLRALDPSLTDLLDDLDQDHARLADLIVVSSDTSVSLPKRSPALRDLHRDLAAHLEREEAEAVPAIRRLIPAAAWALEDKRFQDELGADRTTALVWMPSHVPPAVRGGLLAELPLPARALYRAVWRPRHRRQVRLMYGAAASS